MSNKRLISHVDDTDLLTISALPRFDPGSKYCDLNGQEYTYLVLRKGAGSIGLKTGFPVGWYKSTTDFTVTADYSDSLQAGAVGTTLAYTTAISATGAKTTLTQAGTVDGTTYDGYYLWVQTGGNVTARFTHAGASKAAGNPARWAGDGYLLASGVTGGSANICAMLCESVTTATTATAGKEVRWLVNY